MTTGEREGTASRSHTRRTIRPESLLSEKPAERVHGAHVALWVQVVVAAFAGELAVSRTEASYRTVDDAEAWGELRRAAAVHTVITKDAL